MSKEFNNPDELFQAAFAGEAADVPEFVKSNIDKKLNKNTSRKGFYLAGLLIIGLPAAIAIYLTGSDTVEPDATANPLAASTATEEMTTENERLNVFSSPSVPNDSGENSDHEEIKSATSPHSSTVNFTAGNNDQSSAPFGSSSPTGVTSTSSSGSVSIITGPGVSVAPVNQDPGGNLIDPVQPGYTGDDQKTSNEPNRDYPADLAETAATGNDPDAETADTSLAENPNETIIPDLQEEAANPDVSIEEEEKYNPWMIGVNGGVNLARSKYIAPTQQEEVLYKQSTHDAPGSTFSIDARYRFNNSLTLGGGLGLTRFIENYYFYKNETNISTTLTWNYLYDSLDTSSVLIPIDSTAVYNTDTVTTILYDQTGATKAMYLQLPVSIGTQIIRNKLRFDLYIAARLNYLVSAGGGYIMNDTFVSFDKNNSIFKTFYVDFLMGGAIHYNIAGGLYLSANCMLRPPLGTMYTGTSFNRSLQYTHLGIGLNWKF